MVKRARGKAAKQLQKKAAEIQAEESNLKSSGWGALGSDVEDPELFSGDNDSEEEQDYESRPRKFQIQGDDDVERLPVIAGGKIQRVVEKRAKKKEQEQSSDEEEEPEAEQAHQEGDSQDEEAYDSDEEEQVDQKTEKDKINDAKERIAELAEMLAEDPEENVNKLREIREFISRSRLFRIKRLAVLALVQIFKDIIPSYRISPLTDAQQREKVSKEVKKLRSFEQTLLMNYKEYIAQLQKFSKKGRNTDPGSVRYILASTAITASCELLENIPHFNFRNDLVGIIVDKVSSKKLDKPYERCITTIEHVFKEDEEGQVSFELVRLLSKMIKARRYKVDPALIQTFLHLRLLTELAARADLERVQKEKPEAPKIKKKDRIPLSKKQKKIRKEEKAIEEEMRKAETAVSAEERERLQGQALKLVFVLYFNILKERVTPLMGNTLEGLAKFAHLVNADLFGDLLEVLRELILERQKVQVEGGSLQFKESATREAMLCIVTAFALLTGQDAGESMNLDLSFFINHFYSAIYALALNPDIEFNHKTLRLEDPTDESARIRRKVNISTETEMMVRSFENIFFKQKGVGKIRAEAFAKRLATSMLHLPEKSVIASLKILDKMNKKYAAMPGMYFTDDRVVNGTYHPEVDVPEQSNPEAATIWETMILENHFDPKIRIAAKGVLRGVNSARK